LGLPLRFAMEEVSSFGACVEAATASGQADDAPERFLG